MIILSIILLVIAIPFVIWGSVVKAEYGVGITQVHKLSFPARDLLKTYQSLPKANRPSGDMYKMLLALDTRVTTKKVNTHFEGRYNYSGEYVLLWDNNCSRYSYKRSACAFQEYHDMYDAMTGIKNALQEQERAMQIAAARGSLSQVEDFVEALRNEHKIVTEVTKELEGM